MPKLKTVKGVKRRFKVTATGKVRCYRAGKRHLLGSKNAKTKRRLRRPAILSRSEVQHVLSSLRAA